jgi:hypothetical protein
LPSLPGIIVRIKNKICPIKGTQLTSIHQPLLSKSCILLIEQVSTAITVSGIYKKRNILNIIIVIPNTFAAIPVYLPGGIDVMNINKNINTKTEKKQGIQYCVIFALPDVVRNFL